MRIWEFRRDHASARSAPPVHRVSTLVRSGGMSVKEMKSSHRINLIFHQVTNPLRRLYARRYTNALPKTTFSTRSCKYYAVPSLIIVTITTDWTRNMICGSLLLARKKTAVGWVFSSDSWWLMKYTLFQSQVLFLLENLLQYILTIIPVPHHISGSLSLCQCTW